MPENEMYSDGYDDGFNDAINVCVELFENLNTRDGLQQLYMIQQEHSGV